MAESLASDTVPAKDLDFVRIDEGLVDRAIAVLKVLQPHGRKVISAESCTGGCIATVLSEAQRREFNDRGRSAIRYAAAAGGLAIVQRCVGGDD